MLYAGENMEERNIKPPELSWTEKFKLIEGELSRDPARSDGLIARTIGMVSKSSVYRVREVLVADNKIPDVPLTNRLSRTGARAKENGASNHKNYNGNRIGVPAGRTVADLCKEAIKAEEAGMSNEDAAYSIGIGIKSYREARAIILLSERTDLSPEEAELTRKALEEMNETHRTSFAYKKISGLVERMWGKGAPRSRRAAKLRTASFSHAMTIVMDACMAAPEIHVPLLSNEERASAVKQIEEAAANLRKLKRKIVEGRWQ